MPLVTATDDDGFVAEISHEMDEQARRNREHNAAMIEEYLRRRLKAAEESMKAELTAQESRLEAGFAQVRGEKDDQAARLAQMQDQLTRAAEALGRANEKLVMQRYLSQAHETAQRRECDQRLAEQLAKRNEEKQTHRCYTLWRVFAATQVHQRHEAAEARKWRLQLEELNGQIDVFKEELAAERNRNAEMDERLKDAFLKGVSALNREAVQALRGGSADNDVAAIEEILSRSGGVGAGDGTRRNSATTPVAGMSSSSLGFARAAGGLVSGGVSPTSAVRGEQTGATFGGICPVHHVDAEHNFYHRCYAPATCDYGPGGHTGVATTPSNRRTPFVVRGNLYAVPNVVAGPQTKPAPSTRSTASRMRY